MNRQMDFDLDDRTICVVVTNYDRVVRGRYDGPPEACYPDEGGESEWHVLVEDEDGTLCVKDAEGAGLTDAQVARIDQMIMEVMEEEDGDY